MAHKADVNKNTDTYHGAFIDEVVYDSANKTAVSVRDGILEYMGSEMGMEPLDKVFKVYRSPATIANAAMLMTGIPITDEHVGLDVPAPTEGGKVLMATMVDALDEETGTTIAIKNKLAASDELCECIDAGKRELSLGYNADLIPHDVYDFEQLDIIPHHLAVVDRGRCGSMCSFLDKKVISEDTGMDKKKLHTAFTDAEGKMNLQQIVELAAALPEAIKSVPVDQLSELLPALEQIVSASKEVAPEANPEGEGEEENEMSDAEKEAAAAKDADAGESDEDKEKNFSDAVAKAADEKSKEFIDAAVKAHGKVIGKARDFVDEDYAFAEKTTNEIMRDALAAHSSESFTDAELPLAFKMLKKPEANYKEFADKGVTTKLQEVGNKEL